MESLQTMHKVVFETKDEKGLEKIAASLQEAGIIHHKWVEQPENIPTCIATGPYYRDEVQQYFKKCQLFK
ncbi:hypothetical protein BC829DRAFT_383559 [Chytridium lagenaria]|nr:hypothetical protein BC829DRAFT_383559 [Chytridium lagenaria]